MDNNDNGTRQTNINTQRSRNWVFTSFDTSPDYRKNIDELLDGAATFTIYQLEQCPDSGREHLQGYVELRESRTGSWLRNRLGRSTHIERRRGTSEQAINYCSKDTSRLEGPFRHGTPRLQGARTDLQQLHNLAADGAAETTLWERHFAVMLKYHRGVSRFRLLSTSPRNAKTQCYVFYGAPGSGKSRYAHQLATSAFQKDPTTKWWDGYDQHPNVIVDDYAGAWGYEYIKNLCDGYPLCVETKGGTTQFTATTIIFTSNLHPREWYPNHPYAELERRLELIARKDSINTPWHLERDERFTTRVSNKHHTIPGLATLTDTTIR